MWNKITAFILVSMVMAGCTKSANDKTPEGALQSYVNAAFSVKNPADKEKLLNLSTGEAHDQLQNMSDDNFMASFGKGIRLVNLKTKDRRGETDGGVSLVYELSYDDGSGKGAITHKKIAYLTPTEEGWRIRGTKNIKEVVEQNDPMVIDLTK